MKKNDQFNEILNAFRDFMDKKRTNSILIKITNNEMNDDEITLNEIIEIEVNNDGPIESQEIKNMSESII